MAEKEHRTIFHASLTLLGEVERAASAVDSIESNLFGSPQQDDNSIPPPPYCVDDAVERALSGMHAVCERLAKIDLRIKVPPPEQGPRVAGEVEFSSIARALR